MTNDPRLIKLLKGSLPEPWANGKPWTSKLDSELKNDWQSGMELLPILKKYGRTPIAIFSRLRQLGELSEELNPVELWNAMNSKDEKGLWDLTKELAKEAPGLAKEVPGLAKETLEGVKSFSKNVGESMKVEAHKHHLEHIEKMKKLEKRAKDVGISEEDLAKLKKDLGVAQGESSSTQREPEGSENLLSAMSLAGIMCAEATIEERFEKHIEKHILRNVYIKGQGVPQDYDEAARWYGLAAQQGDVKAQFNLGNVYFKGQGVPRDYTEAFKWYEISADRDHANAQNELGKMYLEGQGVVQNDHEAAKWIRKAAEQGLANAQMSRAE
jgi:hypothetical protein